MYSHCPTVPFGSDSLGYWGVNQTNKRWERQETYGGKLVENITQAIARDPELALAMMKYLARTVRLLSHQVDQMAFRPAQWRVARYLLSLADGDDCLQCSQDDIADSVSVSRVTVSRILNDLSRRGLVELGYRRIQILNRPGLEGLCREE